VSAPIKNGGHAFPYEQGTWHKSGMTLRDYFAGQALAGLTASPNCMRQTGQSHDDLMYTIASVAYKAADAMLAERNRS
jgi:hypothetical protein